MGQMRETSLAVIVITLNEERNLRRCLDSVSMIADQLIVVDSGSNDKTQEIAKDAGAEVFVRKFNDYVEQKQFALEQANCDWLLSLDADEWLDKESQAALGDLLEFPSEHRVHGYKLKLRTLYLGKMVKYGVWLSEWKLRIVRRNTAHWVGDRVHESLILKSGKAERLKGRLLHDPYRSLAHHLYKMDQYSTLVARRDTKTSLPACLIGIFFEPPLFFLHRYVILGGFLDGIRGLIGTVITSYYFFLCYVKKLEKHIIKP